MDAVTLAERLALALDAGEPRQVVLRYPCACVIEHGGISCAHVDADAERLRGCWLAGENERAAEIRRAREEREQVDSP